MDRASQQVAMRKQAGSKLHRMAMRQLYANWAAPSTWLHTTSPAPACMAAVVAAWLHAVRVCDHAMLLSDAAWALITRIKIRLMTFTLKSLL